MAEHGSPRPSPASTTAPPAAGAGPDRCRPRAGERGAAQLGRQSFEDRRQWLYDADLDAARGYYRAAGLTLEVSASREALVDQDVLNPYREESIDNYILHATYGLGEGLAAGGYGILRDPGGGDATIFLGLFAVGAFDERLTWWLDAAQVRGEEDGTELRGYGSTCSAPGTSMPHSHLRHSRLRLWQRRFGSRPRARRQGPSDRAAGQRDRGRRAHASAASWATPCPSARSRPGTTRCSPASRPSTSSEPALPPKLL